MNDRWLYLRLFHAPGVAGAETDALLVGYVAPTSKLLLERGLIDRFFFLRYFEEGHHLRYRVRLTTEADSSSVTKYLRESVSGSMTRIEATHYEPEIEKYGGELGMELAERQFFYSSRFALACIRRTPNQIESRLLVAVVAFDAAFAAAGVAGAERIGILDRYAQYWQAVHLSLRKEVLVREAPEPDVVTWLESSIISQDAVSEFLAARAGVGHMLWLDQLRRDLVELNQLVSDSLMSVSAAQFLCNLAHTFHNRLGLTTGDEVLIADYLQFMYQRSVDPTCSRNK